MRSHICDAICHVPYEWVMWHTHHVPYEGNESCPIWRQCVVSHMKAMRRVPYDESCNIRVMSHMKALRRVPYEGNESSPIWRQSDMCHMMSHVTYASCPIWRQCVVSHMNVMQWSSLQTTHSVMSPIYTYHAAHIHVCLINRVYIWVTWLIESHVTHIHTGCIRQTCMWVEWYVTWRDVTHRNKTNTGKSEWVMSHMIEVTVDCNTPQHTATRTATHRNTPRCDTHTHTRATRVLLHSTALSPYWVAKYIYIYTHTHAHTHTHTHLHTWHVCFAVKTHLCYWHVWRRQTLTTVKESSHVTHRNEACHPNCFMSHSCHTQEMGHVTQTASQLCFRRWAPHVINTLQDTAAHCNTLQHTAAHRSALQRTAAHCSALQRTATHCNTLQHPARHCKTLQHTATHFNTLQHTAALVCFTRRAPSTHCSTLQHIATHCNTLQQTATHCNTLQHIATHCNTLQHTYRITFLF